MPPQFPTNNIRSLMAQGGNQQAQLQIGSQQAQQTSESIPSPALGEALLKLLQKYQQLGQQGKQQETAALAEQSGAARRLPSSLIGASPAQQESVISAEKQSFEPTIGGARKLIQESDTAIKNFEQLLNISNKLGIVGAVTPTKEVVEGYKNAIRGGANPSVIPDDVRGKVLSQLTPQDWAVWSEQNKKGVVDELSRAQKTNTFNRIVDSLNRSPLIQASERTPVLKNSIASVRKNPSNAALQLNLSYSYIQALDTYQSAVREGELANLNSIDSKIGNIQGWVQTIQRGQVVRPEVAKQIASAAEEVLNAINSAAGQKAKSFKSQADVAGVGTEFDQYMRGFNPTYQQQDDPSKWRKIPDQPQQRFNIGPDLQGGTAQSTRLFGLK